jgi:hypothetical protein
MICRDSSIWQGHTLGLLDRPCKTTIKWKFRISRKRKIPFRICSARKRRSIFVPLSSKNFRFRSVDFCFCFHIFILFLFFHRKSKSFHSTFIPTHMHMWRDYRSESVRFGSRIPRSKSNLWFQKGKKLHSASHICFCVGNVRECSYTRP